MTVQRAKELLDHIYQTSYDGCYSTGRMEARWAKEFYEGAYAKRQAEISKNIEQGRTGTADTENMEGGASYYRMVNMWSDIAGCWSEVESTLSDVTTDSASAEELYNAYDKALDEYWAFMRRSGEGLRLKDVAYWVGAIYVNIWKKQQSVTEKAGSKVVAALSPLGTEKVDKAKEWTERTKTKLADAMNAANGK